MSVSVSFLSYSVNIQFATYLNALTVETLYGLLLLTTTNIITKHALLELNMNSNKIKYKNHKLENENAVDAKSEKQDVVHDSSMRCFMHRACTGVAYISV